MTEIREQGRADGKTELTTAGALLVARQYRAVRTSTALLVSHPQLSDTRYQFDVADAAALPWPGSSVDLVVTSPPYGLDVKYWRGDVPDYVAWLSKLETWLGELYRVAQHTWGRLCLNVPLDRDRGGWQPVSADVINAARAVGWQFRTLAGVGQAPGRGWHRPRQYQLCRCSQRDRASRVGTGLLSR